MRNGCILHVNLLALLWACTMPVIGQTSFAFSYGGRNDERIQGMRQLANKTFVIYGASYDNGFDKGSNYVGCLNEKGGFIWQRYSTNELGYSNYNSVDLGSSFLVVGEYALQSERNAGIALMDYNGQLLVDSIYKVDIGGSGSMIDLMLSKDGKSFTSIGLGSPHVGQPALMLQLTAINGRRVYYSYTAIPPYFSYKRSFKHCSKAEFLVFGAQALIKLDSLGHQIGNEQMVVDLGVHQELFDVIQLDTGFVGILYEPFYNSYLQFYNQDGEMTTRVKLPLFSADGGYAVLNKTKDGGLVLLGTELLVLDAQLRTRFFQRFWDGDYYEWRSVAQASDGGFYGCALDNHKNDATDYDIFVFKTLPDGTVRTGITEQVTEQDMQIYPNPATHTLHLPQQVNIEQVKLCDITGRVVLQQATVVGHALDVSLLQPGYYLLQLTTNKGTYAQRVYITH